MRSPTAKVVFLCLLSPLWVQLTHSHAADGEVQEILLLKSSGTPAYDSAVERAILMAQPLPVPNDPDAFQAFRRIRLVFRAGGGLPTVFPSVVMRPSSP